MYVKFAFDWTILGAVVDGEGGIEATSDDVASCAVVLVILNEEGPEVPDTFIVLSLAAAAELEDVTL